LAVAAVLIGIAGALGVQSLGDKSQKIVAEASLGSKNVATRAVRGSVTIVDTGHGLQMKVDVSCCGARFGWNEPPRPDEGGAGLEPHASGTCSKV
jgi:hypothetical protein